jgi:hypothetical protein
MGRTNVRLQHGPKARSVRAAPRPSLRHLARGRIVGRPLVGAFLANHSAWGLDPEHGQPVLEDDLRRTGQREPGPA